MKVSKFWDLQWKKMCKIFNEWPRIYFQCLVFCWWNMPWVVLFFDAPCRYRKECTGSMGILFMQQCNNDVFDSKKGGHGGIFYPFAIHRQKYIYQAECGVLTPPRVINFLPFHTCGVVSHPLNPYQLYNHLISICQKINFFALGYLIFLSSDLKSAQNSTQFSCTKHKNRTSCC